MIFIASLLMLAHVVDAQNVETGKLNLSTESATAVMPSLKKGDMVVPTSEMS